MRPSRIRYLVVLLTTAVAALLYLHRFCFSFVERYLKEDLHLRNDQVALLLSAFFWSYALAQVPSGWLSDRFGARLMFTLYILLWSLFTGLMGAVLAFAAVLALRLGSGLAQAGAFPTSAALLSHWVPFAQRGLASGIVSYGGRLGGAIAPVLTAYLIVAFVPLDVPSLLQPGDLLDTAQVEQDLTQAKEPAARDLGERIRARLPAGDELRGGLNAVLRQRDLVRPEDLRTLPLPQEALRLGSKPRDQLTEREVERLNRLALEAVSPEGVKKLYGQGWRPVLLVYGVAGVLLGGLFWLLFRNRPEEHPGCNKAEIALIEAGRPSVGSAGPARGLPLRPMLRSRSLWLISLSQFMTNFGWGFLMTWLPRYLAEVHNVPVLQRGWLTGLPIFIGMFGQLAGGWWTDRWTRTLGLRWGRCLPMALTRFLAMAAFLACLGLHSPGPVTAALAVVALATDLGTPASWAYMQDVGGRHVGAVLGWGNMWGNLGMALSPLVLNLVVERYNWPALFLACAAAFLLSGLAALGVDATIPVFARDEPGV